jgi:N-acetylglucosamine-6-sulfatase
MKKIGVVLASVALAVGLLFFGAYTATTDDARKAQAQTAPAKPNIIFILTDDQPESTLRYMPNVQSRLKGEGRNFNNAFNVYPLCCPSRAIIQRGQYAHNTGVFGNEPNHGGGYEVFDQLDREQSTMATWIHDAGYYTGYFGKYMNGFSGPAPPGWDDWRTPTVASDPMSAATVSTTGELTDKQLAEKAMMFARERTPQEQPFFMQVGFHSPHVPNAWEPQYDGKFAGKRVPRTPSFDEDNVRDKPRYIRQDKPPLTDQTNPRVDDACDTLANSLRQNDCQYPRQLRALQTVDQFVADLTDYVASKGELSNTYVVYYTDNGNHWGEHRLDYGKLTPYETDTNFPLLIRGPGVPQGTTSKLLVGNHDIAPTFADIAGARVPPWVDGRSFLRIADADPTNDAPWRTALYVERRWNASWALPDKSSPQYVPPYEGVRTQGRVYLRYRNDPWTTRVDPGFKEFYDLGADPHQLRNLAYYQEAPQATLDRLQERLVRLRGCKADECRAAENGP